MSAFWLVVFAFGMYLLGYIFYSRYISEKVFGIDEKRETPARELEDGIDYVPTNKWILLGHHFTSITGAGPIVGPAIAVIWGWLPALLWVVLGAVFIGAVHDFGALFTSIRNKGKSIGTILGDYVGERVRILFLLLILALAILVNAVFAYVIAKLFTAYPSSVIPAWGVIPLAVIFGYLVYRRSANFVLLTVVALVILYALIGVGKFVPVDISPVAQLFGTSPIMLWIVLLFVYTFFASSLPVWLLLQPRDFLNGIQLIVILASLYIGVLVLQPNIVAPVLNTSPVGAPPMFPFLFITIACGALSGFHALVSSGTTSKQLASERDARTVGYLGFLGESSLAVAVIIACVAGIALFDAGKFQQVYASWPEAKKGALLAVVEGGSNLITALGISKEFGITMISTMIVLFSATTMDTSVRIQRYILNELGASYNLSFLKNKWSASAVAVITSMALVLSKEGGKGGMIFWPVFGAANQILAGLALLVTIVYLRSVNKPTKPFTIPLIGVLVITSTAMFINLLNNIQRGDYLLASVSGIILLLEVLIIFESVKALARGSVEAGT